MDRIPACRGGIREEPQHLIAQPQLAQSQVGPKSGRDQNATTSHSDRQGDTEPDAGAGRERLADNHRTAPGLVVAFWSLPDFGRPGTAPSWRLGDQVLGFPRGSRHGRLGSGPCRAVCPRPPAPAFPDMFPWTQSSVLSSTLSAATCWLFWDLLGLVAGDGGLSRGGATNGSVVGRGAVVFGERQCGRGVGLLPRCCCCCCRGSTPRR